MERQPFFWSQKQEQYVFVLQREDFIKAVHPDIQGQGRIYVEVDVNVAGWGSLPKFEDIAQHLVELPGTEVLSLSRAELLKLKLAGWSEKSRREGPNRANDYVDTIGVRHAMMREKESLDFASCNDSVRSGLRAWVNEFKDQAEWLKVSYL